MSGKSADPAGTIQAPRTRPASFCAWTAALVATVALAACTPPPPPPQVSIEQPPPPVAKHRPRPASLPLPPAFEPPPEASAAKPAGCTAAASASLPEARKKELFQQFSAAQPAALAALPADDLMFATTGNGTDAASACASPN
jgi:hypothetical protein